MSYKFDDKGFVFRSGPSKTKTNQYSSFWINNNNDDEYDELFGTEKPKGRDLVQLASIQPYLECLQHLVDFQLQILGLLVYLRRRLSKFVRDHDHLRLLQAMLYRSHLWSYLDQMLLFLHFSFEFLRKTTLSVNFQPIIIPRYI